MDDPIDGEIDGGGDGALAAAEPGETRRSRGSAVLGVPIEVVVSVGRARPQIAELVTLRRDSVLPLDSRIEDPVELYIGEKLIARGELQEMDDDSGRLAVRLTEVADLSGGV
ncbi:FliM/FliN family flagellar motor switch protein [Rhodovulum sp. DZ06]|uniref:FliM/FliN family flagellar motor switch protein n=1 Tax=Rhodovulum sp. DZ06 TaxID=3425126 RepID=UPI003D32E7FA